MRVTLYASEGRDCSKPTDYIISPKPLNAAHILNGIG